MRAVGKNERKRGWGRATLAAPLCAALLLAATAADAKQRGRDRDRERDRPAPEMQDARPAAHQTRPLPDIVSRVQSTPPYNRMDYIGVANFETRSMIYVLRFLDGRQVVAVRVDARSGRIVNGGGR